MEGFQLMKQGAEARLYKGTYLGNPALIKERFKKNYRHTVLDEHLTKERIKAECRAIIKCKGAGVRTPAIYFVNSKTRSIYMEYFEYSITAKDYINNSAKPESKESLAFVIGEILGKMHANNIIHGDLTTSNLLVVNKKNLMEFGDNFEDFDVVVIDFGLAHVDSSAEAKGVDLYVLERALLSTHNNASELFDLILESYKAEYKHGCKEVFSKLEEIRMRGRKRTMIG